jgi:hypothetical protein
MRPDDELLGVVVYSGLVLCRRKDVVTALRRDHGLPGGAGPGHRALDDRADYLALADATLLLDTVDGLKVVSDERVHQLAAKERAAANQVSAGSALKLRRRVQLTRALRRARNRPGGYWVAAADPRAASQAVTGTLPGRSLHRAVLLSDGASRLVDLFELATWEELLALLDENGPEELLRQVRAAEAVDPESRQWPRTRRSDDATAVYLVLNRDNPAAEPSQGEA